MVTARTKTETTRPEIRALRDAEVPSVLAIVVTHNGREWFRDALVGLNTQNYRMLDVLVVDDASSEATDLPSLKRIAKRHLKNRRWGFVRTPRPLGFGGAINWAMSRVRTDADLLLFIHDDAELYPGAIEAMVMRIVADDDTAIVGPKIVAWDDPSRLEEVGMAVDRFGYPYKGLEEGEIDLGQHDTPAEVFYVTSTCMMIRHDVFRQLRGWDARMRAFSEDLDLCWRARLAGWIVRVEPTAKARHAIALATGQRQSRFLPPRYYIRRNRLRTLTKNVSGVRFIWLIPQFILLAIMEMLGFIILRQPGEIWNLVKAFIWNVATFPQAVAERARVQRARKVHDRQLGRLVVRQSARVRFYIAHQADRLEEAWGRRTDLFARRTSAARALRSRLKGRYIAIAAAIFIGLVLGFRHYLWGPSATVGELLPYPGGPTSMFRTFLSSWQGAGLGYPSPAPPAFLILGTFPMMAFGDVGLAQKLLVLALGLVAFAGGYRLLSDLADRTSRLVAGGVYAMGAVGYAGLQEGALGAMVFGAAAPFAVHSMLRISGWARPGGWNGGRELARLALAAAVSAAFVPGSLILYLLCAVVLVIFRSLFSPRSWPALIPLSLGLLVAWALLLPWSSLWLTDGGVLQRLFDGSTSGVFAAGYRGHSMGSVVLGQTPDAPALFGLALPLLGLVAVLTGEGQRRRIGLALWGLVGLSGIVVTFTAHGTMRPIVASPTEAGVMAALAFAGLAGLAVAAFRLDLPRRGLGAVHAATIGVLAVAGFLVAAGLLPSLWRGEWVPGGVDNQSHARVVAQVRDLLTTDAGRVGQFRTLWVGPGWQFTRTPMLPVTDELVGGARGRVLGDLFDRGGGAEGNTQLQRAIAAIKGGTTDRGGSLLGTFNVRYVVLEPGDSAQPWLDQRDLSLSRTSEDFILLRNIAELPRAALFDEVPVYARSLMANDPRIAAESTQSTRATAEQLSTEEYVAERAQGPGVVYLGESRDGGWDAELDEQKLERTADAWGNTFEAPADGEGRLRIDHDRPLSQLIALFIVALAWIVVLGAAFSKRRTSGTAAGVRT